MRLVSAITANRISRVDSTEKYNLWVNSTSSLLMKLLSPGPAFICPVLTAFLHSTLTSSISFRTFAPSQFLFQLLRLLSLLLPNPTWFLFWPSFLVFLRFKVFEKVTSCTSKHGLHIPPDL